MKLFSRNWCAALALTLASLAGAGRAEAQQATVRGTVTDSSSQRGVPGVQVRIVGTTQGAATDEAGRYVLRNVQPGDVMLRVQRIGFAAADRRVTVSAGTETVADFTLSPVATVLSEVVAIGYGTSSRRDVTAATSRVDSTAIANNPVAGVDAALQGKVPGVFVNQNAGNPGNGISVRVRGPASINAGNQPLYVVDGIPIQQENYTQLGLGGQDITAISGLNPDEIASIDVLKDGASAAIYGSRGSNGVVLITTKRGAAGRTKLTFNAYTGRQDAAKQIGLLNAKQYVEIFNESAANDGYDPDDYDFVPGEDDAQSYDWQDAVFRNAPVSDIQLGAAGGNERTQFYASGSYFNQEGIVIGSQYQRQAGRVNLDFNATRRLSLRTSVGLTREDNDRIDGDGSLDGILTNAIGMQPMRPIYGASSGFGGNAEGLRYSNPVAIVNFNSTNLETLRAIGNVEANLMLHEKFKLTGQFGADVLSLDETQWQSPKVDRMYAASANGVGKSGHQTATKYVTQGFATIDPLASETHRLNIIAGGSAEINRNELNFVRGEQFPSGFTKYVGNAALVTSYDGNAGANNLVSLFTRANYTLLDRYLFSASIRRDGSSRFGAENRYGVFPAVSFGWRMSEEPFLEPVARVADVKLRASYGVTGNQGIPDFASRRLSDNAPYSGISGVAPNQLGNPSLRWEQTRELDVGTDLAFFGGRVGVIADYYKRNTSDLLVSRPIPATTGFTTIYSNVGEIENRGVDLGLQTVNLKPEQAHGFGWTTDLAITWNRNRVTSLYGGQDIIDGINGRQTSIAHVGAPLGSFYMYKFDGVDPETGDAIIRDLDGNGDINASDRMIVGSPHPKYFGGMNNTFTYGKVDLRTFLQFSKGNDVFNMMRIFTDDGACSYDNMSTIVLDRWQKPGDITDTPRMSYDCVSGADLISSRFVEDGSYLRIGEVTLGYQLPSRLSAAMRMENARFYISGRNLHTFTDYTGYNPDVNSAGSDANLVAGTDYYAYPIARSWTFGISAAW